MSASLLCIFICVGILVFRNFIYLFKTSKMSTQLNFFGKGFEFIINHCLFIEVLLLCLCMNKLLK